jgi:hypothetical protein
MLRMFRTTRIIAAKFTSPLYFCSGDYVLSNEVCYYFAGLYDNTLGIVNTLLAVFLIIHLLPLSGAQ